ncbi:MAG: S46 family peptidase [Bacteroidota bacterium]
MKRIALLTFALIILRGLALAGEGMWLPLLLSLNEDDMQSMGLKLSAEDIYSVNQSSLKDAVVLFGRGCTGAVVSDEGLLMTNHHCGYGQIRNRSTPERNLLRDGFWAKSKAEELANPGLSVTFIVRMEDVTDKVLSGIADPSAESALIERRISELEAEAVSGTHYQAEIKPFYYGNEYYLIVKEIFTDVRLVGTPPEAVGRFGNETDNWVWPRHNADFSVFRIYTGPDGKPADYAPENIPLTPRHHFPISIKGVEEGDFTMVYGFPARTQEYLTSFAVDQILNVENPIRVGLRGLRLEVFDREMRANDTIRLMYASKAGISNGYKKWQGQSRGLTRNQTLVSKQAYEAEFTQRINANPDWKAAYGGLLPQFEELYQKMAGPYQRVLFFNEGAYGVEAFRFALSLTNQLADWASLTPEGRKELQAEVTQKGLRHFREYKAHIDRDVASNILGAYQEMLDPELRPATIQAILDRQGDQLSSYVQELFAGSALTDSNRFVAMVENFTPEQLYSDPVFRLAVSLYQDYAEALDSYSPLSQEAAGLMGKYMEAQRTVFSEKQFYPDANQSLRLTYGKVETMEPRDGVLYDTYTTLDGVVAKYQPGDYEFDLPKKLLDLHAAKDYGRYGKDGQLRVAFIASNHTSGGNSGSPILNGEGHLIGLNFDRGWEGTMSDVDYDRNQCRNISVDARYVLFLIDKFGEASYLIDEMTIVE